MGESFSHHSSRAIHCLFSSFYQIFSPLTPYLVLKSQIIPDFVFCHLLCATLIRQSFSPLKKRNWLVTCANGKLCISNFAFSNNSISFSILFKSSLCFIK